MHPDAAAIRKHVEAVVASSGFARSKKLAGFLRWVVERALAGETNSITERNIGLQVYGRPGDFDPKIDGTVRAEAIRLRHKLREYYASTAEPRRIDVPKGSYIPVFSGFEVPADLLPPVRERALSARFLRTAGLVLAIVSVGLWLRHALPAMRMGANEQRAAQLTNEAIRLIRMGNKIAAADCGREAVALAPKDARAHRVLER